MSPTRQSSYNLKAGRSSNNTKRWEQRPYRPICLLSVLVKLQEIQLCRRLDQQRQVVEKHSHQYGFRQGRSTADAVNRALDFIDCIWHCLGTSSGTISDSRLCFACGALRFSTGGPLFRACLRSGRKNSQEIDQEPVCG